MSLQAAIIFKLPLIVPLSIAVVLLIIKMNWIVLLVRWTLQFGALASIAVVKLRVEIAFTLLNDCVKAIEDYYNNVTRSDEKKHVFLAVFFCFFCVFLCFFVLFLLFLFFLFFWIRLNFCINYIRVKWKTVITHIML